MYNTIYNKNPYQQITAYISNCLNKKKFMCVLFCVFHPYHINRNRWTNKQSQKHASAHYAMCAFSHYTHTHTHSSTSFVRAVYNWSRPHNHHQRESKCAPWFPFNRRNYTGGRKQQQWAPIQKGCRRKEMLRKIWSSYNSNAANAPI